MPLVPSTVTISIQDRPSPQGPSVAVSITPDPSTTRKDATSPAVALWLLIRQFVQNLNASPKESHAAKVSRPKEAPVKALAKARRAPAQRRAPHRPPAKRRSR